MTAPVPASRRSPSTVSHDPENAYSSRCDSGPAAGIVQRAPGSKRRCQIATSASVFDAHEFGGGLGASALPRDPAITVMSTNASPSPLATTTVGVSWLHNIVKYGSTILSAAGRFNQIWKSSSGLGSSPDRSGNISQCTMPLPAVIHWVSPRPKRAVAPSESLWSQKPVRT